MTQGDKKNAQTERMNKKDNVDNAFHDAVLLLMSNTSTIIRTYKRSRTILLS
jgi:hypothetical protein